VRWKLVLLPVAREERDVDAADVSDVERTRGVSVRRLHRDLLDVVEERVEAGAPEDPDAGGAQAERSLALADDGEEPSLLPEAALPSLEELFSDVFSDEDDFSEPELSELLSELFLEPPSPEDFDRLSPEGLDRLSVE
jgi:hypothetical protein